MELDGKAPIDIAQLEIKPMQLSDLDEVMELERICFTQPWTRGMFEDDLRNSNLTYYIVARLYGNLVGYAGMWVVGGEVHITTVAVHPKFRRMGMGSKLIRSLLEEAVRREAQWAILEVRQSNIAAQKLYAKWGFKVIGRRKGYYSNPPEDALVLELSDIREALKRCAEKEKPRCSKTQK